MNHFKFLFQLFFNTALLLYCVCHNKGATNGVVIQMILGNSICHDEIFPFTSIVISTYTHSVFESSSYFSIASHKNILNKNNKRNRGSTILLFLWTGKQICLTYAIVIVSVLANNISKVIFGRLMVSNNKL